MIDVTTFGRQQYKPSGKVAWGRFLLLSVMLLIVSCLFGALLCGLYYTFSGWYLVVAFPILAGLSLGWLTSKGVEWSRCRRPLAGATLGLACGAIVWFAQHHAMTVVASCNAGAELSTVITRIDALPSVIADKIRLDYRNLSERKDVPAKVMFWRALFMFLDIVILAGIPMSFGRTASGRAFSEKVGRRFNRSTVNAESGSGDRLVSAMQSEQDLSETFGTIKLSPCDPKPHEVQLIQFSHRPPEYVARAYMQLEYLIESDSEALPSAYLSIVEYGAGGKQQWRLHQCQLLPEETPAALRLFT